MIRPLTLTIVLVTAAPMALAEPPTDLMSGTIYGHVTRKSGYLCGTEGSATFKRAAHTKTTAYPPALIGVPQISSGNPHISMLSFEGGMVLTFSTAEAGKVTFDLDTRAGAPFPSGESMPFKDYSETWNAAQGVLGVNFTIDFPGCSLPVAALFRK